MPSQRHRLQRTDKLQGDTPARADASNPASDAAAILDVHGAPTDLQESGDK
jgi:hypothetical protein